MHPGVSEANLYEIIFFRIRKTNNNIPEANRTKPQSMMQKTPLSKCWRADKEYKLDQRKAEKLQQLLEVFLKTWSLYLTQYHCFYRSQPFKHVPNII